MESEGLLEPPVKKSPTIEMYNENYEKYFLYIKSAEKIKKLSIATELFGFGGTKVLQIWEVQDKLFKMECDSKEFANKILIEQPLKRYNCEIYLPHFIKYESAIIKGIDLELTDEKLSELLNRFYNVKKVNRIHRFDQNTKTKVPTGAVRIEIEGDLLPSHIIIYGLRIKLNKIIPRVRICTLCQRFGHSNYNCKKPNQQQKCKKCSEFCIDECQNNLYCPSCSSDEHAFGDEKCPAREKEFLILSLMNERKITYLEARREFYGTKDDTTVNFADVTRGGEFPALPQQQFSRDDLIQARLERLNKIQLKIQLNKNVIKTQKQKNSANNRLKNNTNFVTKEILNITSTPSIKPANIEVNKLNTIVEISKNTPTSIVANSNNTPSLNNNENTINNEIKTNQISKNETKQKDNKIKNKKKKKPN